MSSVGRVVVGGMTEAARLDLLPPKTGMERPMMERLGMEGEGWGMAEPWRTRKGVVENSETAGCAFLGRVGLRTMGSGTVIETALVVGAVVGFMGVRSGGASSSSDAFLLIPACQSSLFVIYDTRLLLLNSLIFGLFFIEFGLEDALLLFPVFPYFGCLGFGLLCQLSLLAQLCFQLCDLLLQRLFRVALVRGSF